MTVFVYLFVKLPILLLAAFVGGCLTISILAAFVNHGPAF